MTDRTQGADDLDGFDEKILRVLAQNGRITVTDLAETIGLSKSPCQVRLKPESLH